MKIRTVLIYILCSLFTDRALGQDEDNLFERLQAITNEKTTFYSVDGIEITSQPADAEFNVKNISKYFKQLRIKDKELVSSDSSFDFPNYYVFKTEEEPRGLNNNITYYFVETRDKKILGFTFSSVNKTDRDFERRFVRLVRDNAIPPSVYNPLRLDGINFAGRKIETGSTCQWMGINNVQCRYLGQMNWSVHKTLNSATETVNNQFIRIKGGNKGKIIADTTVSVLFEGTETNARKIIYDFTGINSVLVGMSGGKTLTVYFVAAPVRNNFVSCVMSFWNNDQINPSGLPPLLEQVMELKK